MTGDAGRRSRRNFGPGGFKEIVMGVSRGRQRTGVQTGGREISAGDVAASDMAIATVQRRAAVPVAAVGRDVAAVGAGLVRVELRNLAARDHDIQNTVVMGCQMIRN